ncbi:hypothetical protein SEA_TOLLS_30 [Gordonia phage Tolls]|nr:hypothetical protein SEA_TOLLS_30 [Gordonia phage Tolls]
MALPANRFRAARRAAITLTGQKMTKTTSQNFSGTMPVQFTGFAPDPTTPDTIVVSDALQVTGTGLADIVVNLTGGTGNATLTVEVRVNGVSKTPTGTISTGTTSFTLPSVALSHGDLITLWCIARSSTQRNITAASVEVVPLS